MPSTMQPRPASTLHNPSHLGRIPNIKIKVKKAKSLTSCPSSPSITSNHHSHSHEQTYNHLKAAHFCQILKTQILNPPSPIARAILPAAMADRLILAGAISTPERFIESRSRSERGVDRVAAALPIAWMEVEACIYASADKGFASTGMECGKVEEEEEENASGWNAAVSPASQKSASSSSTFKNSIGDGADPVLRSPGDTILAEGSGQGNGANKQRDWRAWVW